IILPISDRFNDYARQVQSKISAAGFRAELDTRAEKVGRKIRDAEVGKFPYMLIVGEKEAGEGTVSVRKRKEGDLGSMSIEGFADHLKESINKMLEGEPVQM
ncbi:MAG: His/Gly/Thr/Pro-type tRNA ligase C-terminal domain-containing protein, partial [Bacteroidota bacterium]